MKKYTEKEELNRKRWSLPKTFAKRWVRSLRNNELKQGNGVLFNSQTKSYCCLGVACVVQGYTENLIDDSTWIGKSLVRIPRVLRGSGSPDGLPGALADKNDKGVPFKKIADWIERNVTFR